MPRSRASQSRVLSRVMLVGHLDPETITLDPDRGVRESFISPLSYERERYLGNKQTCCRGSRPIGDGGSTGGDGALG